MKQLEDAELIDIKHSLQTLWDSCEEATNGTWDKSDEGFEDMKWGIESLANRLGVKLH